MVEHVIDEVLREYGDFGRFETSSEESKDRGSSRLTKSSGEVK